MNYNASDIDAVQKEKAKVDVLERKKQGQLREIKELKMKREGKIEIFCLLLAINTETVRCDDIYGKESVISSVLETFIRTCHLEADAYIEAERDETERLKKEKQKLSEKLKNDPELLR